jgi:ketosteroid isomerase-like protein
MMKKVSAFIIIAVFLGLLQVQADAATQNSRDAIVEQLKRAMQELLDAVAPGDVAVWQKYLADGCIYTDEEGNVMTKEELLKELKPLPRGYIGKIKMGEPKVFVQDNVIVMSHRDREELELYGQKLITWFHSTGTWAKQKDGQWKLVAAHVMAIPNERKPIPVSPNELDEYVGQYRLATDVIYTVTREGDKLFGQRTGRAREELLALCADTFYRKGVWRGEKVFERDGKGKVVRMLDRRENNDLVWERVK